MACVPVFAFCDAMEITYTANVDRADTPSSHPFFLFFNCLRMFFAHDQKHTETLLETLFVFIRRTRRSVRYSCQARRQSLALSPFAARVKDSRQLYLSTAQLQCSSLERILYPRPMFSFFQVTIHLYNWPPIHSQTFLPDILTSPSPQPHL